MNSRQIFMSAITDDKGQVNVGYLVLLRSGQVCAGVIIAMVLGSIMEFWLGETTTVTNGVSVTVKHVFNILLLGQGIGLVLGAYGGALLTGMAAFLYSDSRAAPPAMVQTTTSTTTATVPQAGQQ